MDVNKIYKSLSDIEHTLLRPASFLGSVVMEISNQYVLDGDKFVLKELEYNPGFHKLFDEIISNSVDESKRPKTKLDTIKVEIDQEKGIITVHDNGGIPVKMHTETKMYVPHMIFGNLRSSSNYNDDEERNWVGVNGLGSKITNIFSTNFEVITADGKNKFQMCWTNNMKNHTDAKITKSNIHFTKITYTPELSRFGMKKITDSDIKIIEKRIYEIAGCNPNLNIFFQGRKIIMKSFKDYCQMFVDDNIIYEENKDWQIGVAVSPSGGFQHVSYVNSVYTYDGGSHCDYILNQIVPFLREKINKKYKTDILPGQIKNHIFLFVNSTIIRPSFSSQTKEKLITDIKNFGTEIKLTDKFINSIYKSEITNSITDWLDQKKVADEKKAEREANKVIAKVKVDKLIDCKWAGTAKKDKCRLILTEGDSAICALRNFRSVETDGGLPLRGKSLNVRDLPKSKVMENAEIMAVMAAMGLKFGESPITFDKNGKIVEDKTRFGTIQIYTDADVDGTACAALILNYIHKFWPDLIRAHKIARAETPIIIAEHKKTKKETWFYYDSEYKEWCVGKDLKDYEIHYMKGLGALNNKQSKEIFQNPHLYYYELDDFAEESMQHWFGKDTEMRKKKLAY